MVDPFFTLGADAKKFDREGFLEHLKHGDDLHDAIYEPDELGPTEGPPLKFNGKTFRRVSFNFTLMRKVVFRDCTFDDCRFQRTKLQSVEFHNCTFTECNFADCTFSDVYAKPKQFRKAITNPKYANVAVHLYQELRANYHSASQREFKNDAEYYFAYWRRRAEYNEAKRRKAKWKTYGPWHAASWLYDFALGYGYRVTRLIRSAGAVLIVMLVWNHWRAPEVFDAVPSYSLASTLYFTITTMATLGTSGYDPINDSGFILVVANVLVGILVLTSTISTVFNRLVR